MKKGSLIARIARTAALEKYSGSTTRNNFQRERQFEEKKPSEYKNYTEYGTPKPQFQVPWDILLVEVLLTDKKA